MGSVELRAAYEQARVRSELYAGLRSQSVQSLSPGVNAAGARSASKNTCAWV